MREASVFQQGVLAGVLREVDTGGFEFQYLWGYVGLAVSLTLPVRSEVYRFSEFPAFFEGLLPEGPQLEALLRTAKLDHRDYFGQLLQVGSDMVGSVTVLPR